ncbi:hypothetical protein JCM10908_005978 [Rhodotorula pacifica]|uniref:uncharacterized protein n=1 Tax=Rhodotorula pacifica TaxID=1495444 RepID=UPI003181EA0D
MGKWKPSKLSGGQWRHRHKIAYYAAVGTTSAFDIAYAALVAWNHFGLPAYVWVTTFAISTLEAAAIVLAAVLVKMHIGRRSHADMGDALLPLWCGSLTINIAYLWGSHGENLDNELYWQITAAVGVLSQITGMILVAMSYLYHVVSLRYDKKTPPADEEAASDQDHATQSSDGGSRSQPSSAEDEKPKKRRSRHRRR